AEALVRQSRLNWTIVRPGNVYGTGDEVISVLLTMVRTLPAIPVIGDGDQKFQPIWAGDLAKALLATVERTDLGGRTLEVAGVEQTTINEVLDELMKITDRSPSRIPVPGLLAEAGVKLAGLFGADIPLNDAKLTMLAEENIIRAPSGNALKELLREPATSLHDGLRKLADSQPEQLPDAG